MRLTSIPIAACMVLALTAAGCGGSGGGKPAPTNPGPGLELDSRAFGPTNTYAHQFTTAGTFPYICTIHSGMSGVVTVSDAAAMGDTVEHVTIQGSSFGPSAVTIHTGGNVYWFNNEQTNIAHTVTSN